MIDPFGYDKHFDEEVEHRFQQTLDRCDDEVNMLVDAIDNIAKAIDDARDKMTCIEYKALRTTVLSLVAEKLKFTVNEID